MNKALYAWYAETRKILDEINDGAEKGFSTLVVGRMKEDIKVLEDAHPDSKIIYERITSVQKSFTPEQIDHICCQIGEWYMMIKPVLENGHTLGHMKEKLKTMICGD